MPASRFFASAGALGSLCIASSVIRAEAKSAESSWLVAVTWKTFGRICSTFKAQALG